MKKVYGFLLIFFILCSCARGKKEDHKSIDDSLLSLEGFESLNCSEAQTLEQKVQVAHQKIKDHSAEMMKCFVGHEIPPGEMVELRLAVFVEPSGIIQKVDSEYTDFYEPLPVILTECIEQKLKQTKLCSHSEPVKIKKIVRFARRF